MQHLWRDLRYSVRSLARVPALSGTLVLTIGVGLGSTTAMITVVRAVLVKGLPYADADSLVWIYTDTPPYRFRFSVVDYRALEADHPAFSGVAAYQTNEVTVSGEGAAERVTARSVTGSYFPLLGQVPHIGRLFDPSDDARRDQVVVLTYGYWTQHYGGDPSVLGRSMTIDGASHTIVGVLQRAIGPFESVHAALHRRALADADAQRTILHDGDRPATSGRLESGSAPDAARDEREAVPHLAVFLPGREGHVGDAQSEGARHWRRGIDAVGRAWCGRVRAAHRLRKRGEPAGRTFAEPQPRAGDPWRTRRVARASPPTPPRRDRNHWCRRCAGWSRSGYWIDCPGHEVRHRLYPAYYAKCSWAHPSSGGWDSSR